MTLVRHELKQGLASFCIWTASIGALLAVCIFLFPEMKPEMDGLSDMFSSMGAFTAAFGMDKLGFGTLIGFYAIECGNILGLGGAFYAALCGVGALSKEEATGTAEFLFAHPVSRARVLTEKLTAAFLEITAMNLLLFALSIGSIATTGEDIPWKELTLLHCAYYLLQLEIASVCFGISAFLRKGAAGAGLGIATILYFFNLIANIAEPAAFLRYITPFSYCDGSYIVANGHLHGAFAVAGATIGLAGIAVAYLKYCGKDLR